MRLPSRWSFRATLARYPSGKASGIRHRDRARSEAAINREGAKGAKKNYALRAKRPFSLFELFAPSR